MDVNFPHTHWEIAQHWAAAGRMQPFKFLRGWNSLSPGRPYSSRPNIPLPSHCPPSTTSTSPVMKSA